MMESLYDASGHRKYLTQTERAAFLKAAERASREVRTFCGTLAYTGCRISEALELTADRIDLAEGMIVFESLKKRKKGVYRAVPVPPALLDALNLVHNVREAQAKKDGGKSVRLWAWGRTWAWMQVKEVMQSAGLTDPANATPKGLRHAFGINAIISGVQLNLLKKWMGHAQLSTTAVYADAVGEEEKGIAARMW
jgi:integrase/recombinase XerD